MNCFIANCANKASFECICSNSRKNFCKDHFITHLTCDPPPHNNRQLEVALNPEVINLVIKSLEDLSKKVPVYKRQLIEDFSRVISSFEERSRIVFKSLDDYSKTLNKMIIDIRTSPNSISESRIKKTLFFELNEAKSEVAQWEVFSFSLNNFELNKSIKEWAIIEEDFNYLFTLDQKKFKNKVSEQPNKSLSRSDTLSSNNSEPSSPIKPQVSNPAPSAAPRASISSKLLCSKNHELSWSHLVPFKYFSKAKNFTITCDSCKSDFSSSCWNCDQCSYDNCESCGLKKGVIPPKLKCNNNHELLWRPDAPYYYQLKNQGHNFKCRKCNSFKSEPSWHCRDCDFDICSACGITHFNQNPFVSSTKCRNKHVLIKKNCPGFNINGMVLAPKCDCCKKNFTGEGQVCEPCGYHLCFQCAEFYNNPSAGHPVFRCQNEHLLRWTTTEQFQCDACYLKLQGEHYKCKECNFDLCFNCSNVLIKCIVKNDKKTHGAAQHPLIYKWNAGAGRTNGVRNCNLCNLGYKTGMYACNQCENSYCINCYNDPSRPKPQVNSPQDDLNSLMALHLLGGLMGNR